MQLGKLIKYLNPRFLATSRAGHCVVCGRRTLFILTDTPETIRNHAICVRCRSSSRNRHVTICVLREFAPRGITRLADFANHPEIVVLNTSSDTAIARALGAGANIICSEYFDGIEPGARKPGARNEDVQNLSFSDATFDLVLSEDVFEHVRDANLGFRDVHRVLKPGGFHIFSIPFSFGGRSEELFSRRDGEVVLREPIEYHGDPLRGRIPCYTRFGYDLFDVLRDLGFEARLEISRFAEATRFGTYDSFTFVTRRIR